MMLLLRSLQLLTALILFGAGVLAVVPAPTYELWAVAVIAVFAVAPAVVTAVVTAVAAGERTAGLSVFGELGSPSISLE
jgi:hypothetical protein